MGVARYQRIPKEMRTFNGKLYASKKEMDWAMKFQALAAQGKITEYEEQKRIELVPKDALGRAVCYVADFYFMENGTRKVVDAKGHKTQLYMLKKRILYHLHGIEIEEV
jgi:hypothetical protein